MKVNNIIWDMANLDEERILEYKTEKRYLDPLPLISLKLCYNHLL